MIELSHIQRQDDSPIDPVTLEILNRCSGNINKYGKLYHPEQFFLKPTSIHEAIRDIAESDAHKVCVIGPRGIGKSTLMRAFASRAINFGTHHFITYITKSEGAAIVQTENLKSALRGSTFINGFHGSLKVSPFEGADDTFSKKAWIARGNTFILPRGIGQQVRGLVWVGPDGKAYRPDLVLLDDLSDDKRLMNEELRNEDYEWLSSQVEEGIGFLTNPNWKIIYIDTMKHQDDIPMRLMDDPTWKVIQLSICTDDYKTIAPDFKSQAEIDALLEKHRKANTMDIFAREYQGIPASKETASFKSEYYQYYNEDDEEFQSRLRAGKIITAVLVDPAKTAKTINAESGYVVWGIDVERDMYYMRLSEGLHLSPSQIIDHAFELCDYYKAAILGIEVDTLNEFITQPIKNEMIKRRSNVHFMELKARKGSGPEISGFDGSKVGRARQFAIYYETGHVKHNRIGSGPLEAQQLAFPKPKRWDVLDAAGYIVQVVSATELYFFFSRKGEDEYSEIHDESEFDEIFDEPAYNYNGAI